LITIDSITLEVPLGEVYDVIMKSFYKLTNQIMNYAWGHHSSIPIFLGIPNPEDEPFAEMWMGAHPKASSRIDIDETGLIDLSDFIAGNEIEVLGPDISREFGRLPFLFKLLAAGDSLSIQAHPSKELAEEGFKREDEAGIPRDAAERNYRDDNHKPEIIMALEDFTAMIGFRDPEVILKCFSAFDSIEIMGGLLKGLEKNMQSNSSKALNAFLQELLTLDAELRATLLSSAVQVSEDLNTKWEPVQRYWVKQLLSSFPDDVGALAPLFLHVVELKPGEALFQPAGALHAYLRGFGIELMANSDNVLRGGLTKKHIDVPELMKVLEFKASEPEILKPGPPDTRGIRAYPSPVREFSLGLSDVFPGKNIELKFGREPMIVLVMEGNLMLHSGSEKILLERGESAFIPWNAENITISGRGRGAIAGIGSDFGSL